MLRKDKKPKLKARRNKPEYRFGFRNNPATAAYRHPSCDGYRTDGHYTLVSLFSGCGGMDLSFTGGFKVFGKIYPSLPFDVIGAYDFLPDAVECHKLNLGDYACLADLKEIPVSTIPPADILTGGFPCQDFSSSGPKTGFGGKRGKLYEVLVEYMDVHRPKLVVGENVPHLARLKGGAYLTAILKAFERAGYHFDLWELYAPDYGVPQSRRRLFFVGVRDDLPGYPVRPAPVNRYMTISEALADLEPIVDETITNQSQFFVSTKASSGGGQGDHKNDPDKVAYCIRANARGRIQFHHHLDRRLTVRECARLQTFPDQFVFPYSTQRNLTLIGNAVPPVLGYHVAKSVATYLAAVLPRSSEDALPRQKGLTRNRCFPIQETLFA
jgi:DNA (cytosine-5)-methyltransferase 1